LLGEGVSEGNAPSCENGGAAPRRRVAFSSSSCFSSGEVRPARAMAMHWLVVSSWLPSSKRRAESGVDRGVRIAQLIGRELFQDLDPLGGPGRYR